MNHFWNIKLNANISSEDVSNDSWKEKTCKYPNEYEYFDETTKESLGNSKMKQNLKKSLILLA